MALITVVINKRSDIRSKIRKRYNELFQGWRRENPNNREYTIAKLNANIRNVLSVNGQSFKEKAFRPAAIKEWSGRKVLPFAHWFFLVRFQADSEGRVYAIVEDACYEGDYHNDNMNTKPYGESQLRLKQIISKSLQHISKDGQQSIRLTEAQFKRMLTECITKIINESNIHESTKKVGKYNAIDGSWWDGWPHGLENFGAVQDVRMYDNTEMKGDKFETIGLFRQISSMKFFFAKIVPIKGASNTKWIPIHIEEVPKIILKDLKTINPHGYEPYLPF